MVQSYDEYVSPEAHMPHSASTEASTESSTEASTPNEPLTPDESMIFDEPLTPTDSAVTRSLRAVGLTRRAVPSAVVGPQAYVSWWQRVLAFVALLGLLLVISVVLVASMGLLLLIAGLLLEVAIS